MRGYIFVSIPQITFKHGFFLIILRRSFQCRQWIFSNLFGSKVEKNAEGSIELRSKSVWGCLGGGGEGRECLQGRYCPRHSTTHSIRKSELSVKHLRGTYCLNKTFSSFIGKSHILSHVSYFMSLLTQMRNFNVPSNPSEMQRNEFFCVNPLQVWLILHYPPRKACLAKWDKGQTVHVLSAWG